MVSDTKRRVVAFFPKSALEEWRNRNEITIDSMGRVRGFSDFVLRNMKRGGNV